MTAEPDRRAAMYAVFQKICETLSLADIEKGTERALVGAEAVRRIVREEMGRAVPGPAPAADTADKVMRVVDSRIDQFLARHLKSKDLAERIASISRSEARLVYATSVDKIKHEIEARTLQEVEKAIDDLLRSDALADRIRRVAREAAASAVHSGSAS